MKKMSLKKARECQRPQITIRVKSVAPSQWVLIFMHVKFMFSKKATKIDEIFTVDLTLCSKCQIYGEDFVNFRGLLGKYELYYFLIIVV